MDGSNNTIQSLASKIDSLIQHVEDTHVEDLTDDERKAMKEFVQLLVALQRLRRFGIWLLILVGVVASNWEKLQHLLRGFFHATN